VYCQQVYLRGCHTGRLQQALAELPETLDETYSRTLRQINNADWDLAHRLFQCVAVASRPLSVEELAEFLAFEFKEPIPGFHEGWREEDPLDAVLTICSSLLSVVNEWGRSVIQFSHFSVKEFLMSDRLSKTNDEYSRRYHTSLTSAHTVVARACLGILLHLDTSITEDGLEKFPLADYAAEHWVDHARFENVSANAEEGMKRLFDPSKPHLGIWLWIYDPELDSWKRKERDGRSLTPRGTALHYAALCGLEGIVEFLVNAQGQDVHSRAFGESTALHVAAHRGHAGVGRVLLELGADPTAKDKDGKTPLHVASEWGNVEAIRLLLEKGADPTAQDKDGKTPLHFASRSGNVEAIRLLLEKGADPTAQDKHGKTPLHFASRSGNVEAIRLLLEKGADPTAQDKHGKTPFHFASRLGNVEAIRLLLEKGADPTAQDKYGKTPLHFASESGNVEAIRLLLEKGADPTAQDKDGNTPLHFASRSGNVEAIRLLLEKGADPTAQDKDGNTPLHFASRSGNVEAIRLLLEKGADPTAQDKDGNTPLHFASRSGNVEAIRLLLEKGADPTAQDKHGNTPLHFASRSGNVEAIRLLLEKGADPTAQDKHGKTPLHFASAQNNRRLWARCREM
jgi:ankyrin repeat protein